LELAPGRIDLAAAITSTAVNVGISTGALGGGLLIEAVGLRDTVLAAGILSAVGLVFATDKRPRRSAVPATAPPSDFARSDAAHSRHESGGASLEQHGSKRDGDPPLPGG
jgi:hypothetical protein